MTITVELPNDIASHENGAREAAEAVAIQAYRDGSLTHRQAAAMLGLYWLDFEGLLKERGITEGEVDEEMLQRDMQAGDRLRAQGLIPG